MFLRFCNILKGDKRKIAPGFVNIPFLIFRKRISEKLESSFSGFVSILF